MTVKEYNIGVDRFGINSKLNKLSIDDTIIRNFLDNEFITSKTNLTDRYFSDLFYLQIILPESFTLFKSDKNEVQKGLNHLCYNTKNIKVPSITVDYNSKKLFNKNIRTMMSSNNSENLSITLIETSNLLVKKIFWEFLRNLHPDINTYQFYPIEISFDVFLAPLKYLIDMNGDPVLSIAGEVIPNVTNKNTNGNIFLNEFMKPHAYYFKDCQISKISNSNFDVYESQKNHEATILDLNYSYMDFLEIKQQ